ncbi:hypothetical protein CBOM_08004 [Ceraceosorus bombacis]|uniref:Uncharacterized protein n=1 Tax=Ceraceosorus bombacis TaxID=401625 RepID=A0A0P1BIU7_9BASI|nr:hypothetical protein CBOM_08004 [Ceraceosorus bombacis]
MASAHSTSHTEEKAHAGFRKFYAYRCYCWDRNHDVSRRARKCIPGRRLSNLTFTTFKVLMIAHSVEE